MSSKRADHNDGRGNVKSKAGGRGSVNNTNRLAAFQGRERGGKADWGSCDSQLLQAVVIGITELGGAVTIGLSRDGGAHSLTLLLDQDRKTFWYNGDADLDENLREVIGVLEGMA